MPAPGRGPGQAPGGNQIRSYHPFRATPGRKIAPGASERVPKKKPGHKGPARGQLRIPRGWVKASKGGYGLQQLSVTAELDLGVRTETPQRAATHACHATPACAGPPAQDRH